MLHELIEREDSCCLFCESRLSMEVTSEWIGNTAYTTETLNCTKCTESFRIHSFQLEDGETVYEALSFSLNDIHVFNEYGKCIILGKKAVPWPLSNSDDLVIPEFDIDFSDKDKLYEKIRTYLLFS